MAGAYPRGSSRGRWGWLLAACLSCRGYYEHDTSPGDSGLPSCQPYALECQSCTLADDLALPAPLREWRCEDPALGLLTGVTHRADAYTADDEHYYDADGLRVAARRRWDEPVPACGTEVDVEWWGAVLRCEPTCELDPTLAQADPALPACD